MGVTEWIDYCELPVWCSFTGELWGESLISFLTGESKASFAGVWMWKVGCASGIVGQNKLSLAKAGHPPGMRRRVTSATIAF